MGALLDLLAGDRMEPGTSSQRYCDFLSPKLLRPEKWRFKNKQLLALFSALKE